MSIKWSPLATEKIRDIATYIALDKPLAAEQWIEKNSKPLFYTLVGIVVLFLAYLAYNKYIVEPNEFPMSFQAR